jgi:hypothetical protein
MGEGRKRFFFEKKNQKTFGNLGRWLFRLYVVIASARQRKRSNPEPDLSASETAAFCPRGQGAIVSEARRFSSGLLRFARNDAVS